jgi:hypothetical protein
VLFNHSHPLTVGDKDVVTAPAELKEDWQKALYAEFLRWQASRLVSPRAFGSAAWPHEYHQ